MTARLQGVDGPQEVDPRKGGQWKKKRNDIASPHRAPVDQAGERHRARRGRGDDDGKLPDGEGRHGEHPAPQQVAGLTGAEMTQVEVPGERCCGQVGYVRHVRIGQIEKHRVAEHGRHTQQGLPTGQPVRQCATGHRPQRYDGKRQGGHAEHREAEAEDRREQRAPERRSERKRLRQGMPGVRVLRDELLDDPGINPVVIERKIAPGRNQRDQDQEQDYNRKKKRMMDRPSPSAPQIHRPLRLTHTPFSLNPGQMPLFCHLRQGETTCVQEEIRVSLWTLK